MTDFEARFRELSAAGLEASSFIDGCRMPPDGLTAVDDPATGKTWASTSIQAVHVEEAAESASNAFADRCWSALGVDARSALLDRLADLVEENAAELALYETLASGKTISATVPEMRAAAVWLRYYAGLAASLQGATRPLTTTAEARIAREPLGVVAAITPFNAAFSLSVWKIAPALAMGNAVIVKPPPEAAFSSLRLAVLAIEAGFPAGILNVVIGGPEEAMRLARDRRVAAVSITGSTAAARAVGAEVTGRLKHFSAEAGGKSAHIVFDDCDIDNAVIAATQGAFSATGQTCVAGARLLLHNAIRGPFLEKFADHIARLRIGNPRLPATHIGPLAGKRHEERVGRMVAEAVEDGARVLVGGARPELEPELAGGSWFQPTVLSIETGTPAICREEVFGPVVTVQGFDTEDEALDLANSVDYGLAAGLWTDDIRRIHRMSRALQAGTVWVNTYRMIHWRAPFGGYRQSGLGRENGPEALAEFSQIKSIIVEHGPVTDPFGA